MDEVGGARHEKSLTRGDKPTERLVAVRAEKDARANRFLYFPPTPVNELDEADALLFVWNKSER